MQIRNTAQSYGLVAQLIHWGTVGLITWLFWLGFTMTELSLSPEKFEVYALHKSLGLTVLTLTVFRLIWRHLFARIELVAGMSPLERKAAHITHVALYLLLIAIPVSGWLHSSATAIPVSWFNLFTLPNPVSANKTTAEILKETHEVLGLVLLGFLALHVAGALNHHFIKKDRTLVRMIVPAKPQD